MKPLVVFCAGTSWDGVVGSDRQLATALRRYVRVLWVDPPVSMLTPARYRGTARRGVVPRLSDLGGGAAGGTGAAGGAADGGPAGGVEGDIVRLTPTALPGWTRPGVRATTWPLVRAQLRWALRRLAAQPYAVVACSLNDVLSGWPQGVRRVFYGTDDYVAGARLMGTSERRLAGAEPRQLDRADLVVAVSPVLAERWSAGGARPVAVLPNGCDADRFGCLDDALRPDSVPAGRPVVGLIGQLSERIDLDLLFAVAELDCTLLLVGPRRAGWAPDRFAELTGRPNVVYAGPVPLASLSGYLGAIDVGITPYADSAFNRASFPLKTLEYLAAGRAVVSTDLPATRWLATDLVRTARGPAEFAAAVLAALPTAHDPLLTGRRRTFAAGHSWPRRAEQFAGLLGLTAEPNCRTPAESICRTPAEPIHQAPRASQQATCRDREEIR